MASVINTPTEYPILQSDSGGMANTQIPRKDVSTRGITDQISKDWARRRSLKLNFKLLKEKEIVT